MPKPATKTLSLRLNLETIGQLDEIAAKLRVSRQDILMRLIDTGLPAFDDAGQWPASGDFGILISGKKYLED